MKLKRYTFDKLSQKLIADPNGKYCRVSDAVKWAHESTTLLHDGVS